MNDIQGTEDVKLLIDAFYAKLLKSDIAYIFTDVAQIDLKHHLPILYEFWNGLLSFPSTYRGNAMLVHLKLSQKAPLSEQAFEVWLDLFGDTVDDLFAGEKADEAKQKARNIAGLMKHKIAALNHGMDNH